jgi:hypothetical protein
MHTLRSKVQPTTSAWVCTRTRIRVLRTVHSSSMHMRMRTMLSLPDIIVDVPTCSRSSRDSVRGSIIAVGPLRLLTVSISPKKSRETLTEQKHEYKVTMRPKDIEFGRQREDKQPKTKTVRVRHADEAYFERRNTACAQAESFALSWHNELYRNSAKHAAPQMSSFSDKPRLRRLRVGTDCSGIEAPIRALDNMNIPFHHVFASDIDPKVRKTIRSNFAPDNLYADITLRDPEKTPPVDL